MGWSPRREGRRHHLRCQSRAIGFAFWDDTTGTSQGTMCSCYEMNGVVGLHDEVIPP
ncbi:hypothetical protein Tco_0556463, partial [Tanacetum coccineum]